MAIWKALNRREEDILGEGGTGKKLHFIHRSFSDFSHPPTHRLQRHLPTSRAILIGKVGK